MRSRTKHILAILILCVTVCFSTAKIDAAELTFPTDSADRVCYSMQIDFGKAYVSGVCILLSDGELVKSSIVNEFGLSIMDFTYNPWKDKVKLIHMMKSLDKWYIKRTLKGDLKKIMHIMQDGGSQYYNKKRKIKYTFAVMNEAKDDDTDNSQQQVENEIAE